MQVNLCSLPSRARERTSGGIAGNDLLDLLAPAAAPAGGGRHLILAELLLADSERRWSPGGGPSGLRWASRRRWFLRDAAAECVYGDRGCMRLLIGANAGAKGQHNVNPFQSMPLCGRSISSASGPGIPRRSPPRRFSLHGPAGPNVYLRGRRRRAAGLVLCAEVNEPPCAGL